VLFLGLVKRACHHELGICVHPASRQPSSLRQLPPQIARRGMAEDFSVRRKATQPPGKKRPRNHSSNSQDPPRARGRRLLRSTNKPQRVFVTLGTLPVYSAPEQASKQASRLKHGTATPATPRHPHYLHQQPHPHHYPSANSQAGAASHHVHTTSRSH